jgi:Fe2+ transport system protein FeoA
MSDHSLIPLDQLAPGAHAVVRVLRGGADFAGRLAAMGLAKGTCIEMLQNTGGCLSACYPFSGIIAE